MRALALVMVLFVGCRPAAPVLTAAEVYARLSPSIAYLSSGTSGGSGVLLDGRLVLTNAHVVWPYERVRVTFSPQLEFDDVPVKAVDVDGDLALVGPLPETLDRPPLRIRSPEGLSIGSEVFLVGYPGEVERSPQPAITRGVLSRVREARFENLTFLQSDATIVGGQSGGALVSGAGDIIGISGLIGIERFALALSGADVLERLPRIDGQPSPRARSKATGPAGTSQPYAFAAARSQAVWFFEAADGDSVQLDQTEGFLSVFDSGLVELESIDGRYPFEVTGPQVAIVAGERGVRGTVRADRPLVPFVDPDDERVVSIGEDVHGAIDHPGDEDRYLLTLEAGERVYIRVDGVLDALCSVLDEAGAEELVGARVAEGGLGMSADLTFEAPRSGTFVVSVAESSPDGPAGYELRVSRVDGPVRVRRNAAPDGGTRRR